jgi:galactokinase
VPPDDDDRIAALHATLGARTPFARAPGRVNLIGDHTDYQDGLCLPMAIDRDVVVAFEHRDDRRIRVTSLDLDGVVEVDLTDGSGATRASTPESPEWGALVEAIARALASRGHRLAGMEAAVASTIPLGAGLSSSAAFEVALVLALARVSTVALAPREVALVAQAAELHATGVPCGIMDQLASVSGRAGHALLLDCRTLDVQALALPSGLDVLVVHSGLPRVLADSAYAERRAACEAAAARLGVRALRDATPEQVADDRRARHVVSENARVRAFADALRRSDLDALGPLMLASHASLRDDFEVSTPELDLLVELLVEEGARGARLTGAGFGGCVVALVDAPRTETVAQQVTLRYGADTGLLAAASVVHAAGGACISEPTT